MHKTIQVVGKRSGTYLRQCLQADFKRYYVQEVLEQAEGLVDKAVPNLALSRIVK